LSPLSASDVAGLLDRPGGRRAAMLLAGCGFAVPKRAAAALAGLVESVGDREFLAGLLPALLEELSAVADPDAALDGLVSLVAAAGDAGRDLVERLAAVPDGRRVLLALLSSSRAFTSTLARWPQWVDEVIAPGEIDSAHSEQALDREISEALGQAGGRPGRLAVLRRFRRRHTLGIAARDIAGRTDLAATTAEISAVADAVIRGALQGARAECGAGGAKLAVLAMGKLGGAELNYSSDIDLIFVGSGPGEEALRLAEELVRQLSEPTADGVAYRVDMRLRPEGSAGALVWDLAAALNYYRSRARPWERQALIKCRPVAGDMELGRFFLEGIAELVWRSGLTPAEVGRACQLRSDMERAAAGAEGSVEVKSGAGGIRDVEFAVQILQLAYGAEHPEVRQAGTLRALESLEGAGLISDAHARVLRAGYEFLRRVEHCLQTMDELAMHAVPSGAEERAALARRLGYGGSPEAARRDFESDLAEHSAMLRSTYEQLCGQGASGEDLAGRLSGLVAEKDDAELVSLLSVLGFGGGRRSAKAVRALTERSAGDFALVASLLERLRSGPGPDRGLSNLEGLADAALLRRLAGDSQLRESLISVAECSDFLAGLLCARPECVDMLTPGEGGRARRGRERLAADFAAYTAGAERGDELAARMAAFRERELVRVGARDLLDGEPPGEVSAELSLLAELELEGAVTAAGVPEGVAVLALGRLGGREMSYGSDLDLVFVEAAAGADPNSAVLAATRMLTSAGYEVDTRLRPAGSSGQLVASLAGYRSYRDRGELAVWERLALVRARPLAGSQQARAAVEEFLTETLYGSEPPSDLAARTWDMRLRLERTAEEADFKRGTGGLVDLEFLAEFLALAHGGREPAMRARGTGETFSAAGSAGVMPRAEAAKAAEAFGFLRRLEMRARVLVGRPVRSLPSDPEELTRLGRMMEVASGDGAAPTKVLRAAFERHTATARRLLERALAP
jgi:glutamate-ammonia-ligase adenylyltransferase